MATSGTLLGLVTAFCQTRGLVVPAAVISSQDQTITQIRRVLLEGIRELADEADWKCQQLLTPAFAHANGTNYLAYDLAITLPDYKWMVPQTIFETTTRLPVAGPLSEQQRSFLITQGVAPAQYSFWIGPSQSAGGQGLYVYPYSAAARFQFQYQSNYPIIGVAGSVYTAKETYSDDTDLCVFPARLLLGDLNWRWNYKKGFPYAEEKASFERMKANLDATEAGMGKLSMDGGNPNSKVVGPGLLIAAGSWPL